jgi:hypothetical protein
VLGRLIGNAVPVRLGEVVGQTLITHASRFMQSGGPITVTPPGAGLTSGGAGEENFGLFGGGGEVAVAGLHASRSATISK